MVDRRGLGGNGKSTEGTGNLTGPFCDAQIADTLWEMKRLSLGLNCVLVLEFAVVVRARQTGDKAIAPVRFINVAPKDVEIDPFVSSTPVTNYRGKIVYDDQAADRSNSYEGHRLKNHILVRRVGGAASGAEALTPYLSKRAKGENGAPYDPQFSPDGRFVLWKFGIISPYVIYEMYVLDLKTNVVKRVEDPVTGQAYQPSVREVRWSPDSKFLAWGEDVDFNKPGISLDAPFSLHICNWRTGRSRTVARGEEVRHAFSWVAPHTMFWSQLPPHPTLLPPPQTSSSPEDQTPGRGRSIEDEPLIKEHPRLFEMDAAMATAKPREVLADAFRVVVSPSGKQLAFFGSYDISKPSPLRYDWSTVAGSAMYLSVANRNGSHHQAINIQAGSFPQLVWQHDDRHLLSLEIEHTAAYDLQEQNRPHSYNITLRQFDLTTNKMRILAESLPGGDDDRLLSVSADDRTLYLFTNEALDEIKNKIFSGAYKVGNSIIAIDLQSGKRTTIAQTINSLGLDWHDDASTPTAAKPRTQAAFTATNRKRT